MTAMPEYNVAELALAAALAQVAERFGLRDVHVALAMAPDDGDGTAQLTFRGKARKR